MGRFRSLLRRVARPAATVAVVGVLSSMLIVSTPSNAHAFRDLKAAETFVIGATKTVAPAANVALAAASFSPVGLGIRLLQLGFIAYSTQDVWMPLVAGAFGEATAEDENAPAPGGTRVLGGFTFSSVQQVNSNVWQVNGVVPYTENSQFIGYAANLSCKNRTTGAITQRQVSVKGNISAGPAGRAWSWQVYCGSTMAMGTATNEDIVGGVVGSHGAEATLPASCFSGGNATPACYWPGPANVFQWGNQLQGGDPAFDPYGENVKYKVKSECIDAAGVKTTIEAESSGDMVRFPSCEAAGKGHGTGKNSITGLAPGKTVEQPLWDSPAAPSDPATPLCDASRPTGGCVLSVELDGKPCAPGDPECENWAEIEKNDPGTTRLKCRFGPYTLPIAQCAMLEKAYFPGGAPATEENTDGNPDTQNWNDPRGNPIPARPPTSTTQTVPGSSGQPVPGPSGSPEAKMANCFPTGWAMLNPVEWVLKPVRCAFEPSQTPSQIQARANGVMQLAQGKAPISFITNLSMTGPSGGGCPNWTINVNGLSENVVCESSFTHALLAIRAPLFGLVATAMVWPLLRSIWYAAIPVLRVSPSSGGK